MYSVVCCWDDGGHLVRTNAIRRLRCADIKDAILLAVISSLVACFGGYECASVINNARRRLLVEAIAKGR